MNDTNLLALPALSIRAPWWWFILYSTKRHENREWTALNPARRYRGAFTIHASKSMTRKEYADAVEFACAAEPVSLYPEIIPSINWFKEHNGGLVGRARVTDFITADPLEIESEWYVGPGALVLTDVEAIDFVPCKGALGFFIPAQLNP